MDLDLLSKRLFGEGNSTSSPSSFESGTLDIDSLIDKYSQSHPNVPKNVIKAMIEQESGGDPNAVGPETKYGTAKGLGQFIDSTAQQYIPGWKTESDSFDPEKNIAGMFAYMDDLIKQNNGDINKAVGRYFGTGIDPILNKTPEQYSSEVMGKVDSIGTASPAITQNESSLDTLSKRLFSEPQNTQVPFNQNQQQVGPYNTPGAYAGMQAIGTPPEQPEIQQEMPVQQPIVEQRPEQQKKSLPFIGNFVEMLKTMARAPITTVRGTMEAAGSAAKKVDMAGIESSFNELLKKKEKYKDGIPPEKVLDKWPSTIPYETLSQAKMQNGNYDADLLAVILSDYKKKSESFDPKAVTEPIRGVENLLKEKDVQRLGGIGGVMQDLTSGITQVGAQVGLNIVNPSLAAGSMITLIGGTSIDELEKKGVDPLDASALALANAALQYPLEKIGLGKITDNIVVKNATGKVLKRITSSFLGEGITESIQEIPDYVFTDWFVKTKGMNLKDRIDTFVKDLPELGKKAGYSGLIGGLTGSAVTGAGIAIGKIVDSKNEKERKSIENTWNSEMDQTKQKLEAGPNYMKSIGTPSVQGVKDKVLVTSQQKPDFTGLADRIQSEQQQPETPRPEVLDEGMQAIGQPETAPEDEGVKIVEPTEEQKKKGSEIIKGIEGVVFQGLNAGLKGKSPKNGKVIDIPATYEFKDTISGGNFTLNEEQVNEQTIKEKIAEKRKTIEVEKVVPGSTSGVGSNSTGKTGKIDATQESGTGKSRTTVKKSDVPSVQPVTDKKEESTVSPDDKLGEVSTALYTSMLKFREKSAKDRGVEISDIEKNELTESSKRQAQTIIDAVNNKDIGELEARLTVLNNKGSRKGFEIATGITLPSTSKGTREAIRKFVGEETYDKFQKEFEENRLKKEEERKQKEYTDAQNKELDAKIRVDGTPSTYRQLIDSKIESGWKVTSKKVGIRTVYRITDGSSSYDLPTKKIGEYANLKYDEKIERDIPESQRMTQEEEDHLFGKKSTTGKETVSNEKTAETSQKTETVLNEKVETPSVLFHGTRSGNVIEKFNLENVNKGVGSNGFSQGDLGVYLTSSETAAKYFSRKAGERYALSDKTTDGIEGIKRANEALSGEKDGNIVSVKLPAGTKIKDLDHYPTKAEAEKYQNEGYDGLRFDETGFSGVEDFPTDRLSIREDLSKSKTTVIFDPEKIKVLSNTDKVETPSSEPNIPKNVNNFKRLIIDRLLESKEIQNSLIQGDENNFNVEVKSKIESTASEIMTENSKEWGGIYDQIMGDKEANSREISEFIYKKLKKQVASSEPNVKGVKVGDTIEVIDSKKQYTVKSVDVNTGKIIAENGHTYFDKSIISGIIKKVEVEDKTPSSDPNTRLVNDYVHLIKTHHGNKEKIPNTRKILDLADKEHGGTIAEGKYGIRDAYDALETAMNKYVEEIGLDEDPKETIKKLNTAIKVLPTQTVRTEEQVEKQQFSTPPSEAYLAVMASGIKPGMSGLEPSAGDGNIATIMRLANKGEGTIHVNEIDERRRNNLKVLGFEPTNADAEYLHSTLPKEVQPDVVVMNPPFSATGGRLKQHDTGFGAEHVRQALLRLKDGGRLVAIVGNGMAFGKPKMASWWNGIRDKYNVRANVGISGKEYEKYGTGFDNNIIVIDKTGKTGSIENIITGSDLTIEKAYDLLSPLMKEDVNGRIKRDNSDRTEEVVGKKPEGKTTEKISDSGTVSPSSIGSGRGSTENKGTGTKQSTVENVAESGNELPGEGRSGNTGKTVKGSEGTRAVEDERKGNDTTIPESGSNDIGRPERKPSEQGRIEEEEGGVYAKYKVKKAIYSDSVPHQADIVESATMASVDLPDVSYKLSIPKEIIKKGAPSDMQLEAATYACQTHEQLLPDGRRKEFLLGDSTGTGKTITILSTIYENWLKSRKKSIVITKSKGLIKDLRDDMKMMGVDIPVIDLSDYKISEDVEVPEGILFSTYATASGNWIKGRERYNQIVKWFGKDSDGVFVFDEAHMMKNANAEQPTNTGSMGVKFKEELKNARFLNASATAATNSKNLAYLTRMGLWGEGSSFKNFTEFLGTMSQGGLGAMELLSRDMKANGNYISRTISYKGVDYETLNHPMNEAEISSYNGMADFWSEILQSMDKAAKNSGLKGRAARNHAKQYYAAQQRFFLQLMVSFQVETMLKDADKKLNEGKSVVISLFNTNEQQTEKKVGDAEAQGIDIDDMDFTPRDMMIDMIKKNFPVYQYQEVQHDDGTKEFVQVKDDAGNPLINAENEIIMNELVDKVATFKMPDNPLDRIVNYFGEGKVAEVTGRKKRLVMVNGKKVYKARATKDVSAKDVNRNELDQFMDGKKRVAVLSGAAATGFSFHASTKKKNQQRRVFYALQLSWSADQQMQAFGRVHRTMQASAPEIVLVQTDIASQKRLVNTIQSRLASLGAISKGERESLSGGIFSIEDITDDYGAAALRGILPKVSQDNIIRMGLYQGPGRPKDIDVDGFMNRLMVLKVKDQNEIFDQFYGAYLDAVDKAKEAGQYDTGVEKIKGDNIRIEGEPILLSDDKQSGVKTEILNIAHDVETVKRTFKQANERLSGKKVSYVKNKKSGDPYMAYVQESDIHIYGPRWISKKIPYTQVREEFYDKYEKVEDDEFEKLWSEKYKEIPKVTTQHTHILTGSIFQNYKKIFDEETIKNFNRLKIYRAKLDNGSSRIGVYIPSSSIERIKQNFGIGTDLVTASPEKIIDLVKGGSIIEFDNRWKLKKSRVMGEDRIELNIGNEYNTGYIEKMGLFNEIIAAQKRYFVPTGDTMIETVKNIMERTKPVRDLTVKSEETVMASAPLVLPTYKITDLAKPITPDPVKVDPIKSVKSAPSGKRLEYAKASQKLDNHITSKPNKADKDTGFLTRAENYYRQWVDLSFPISKVEDIYDKDMGVSRETIREIDIAIDRVRGSGGIAKQFIDDNLKPIFDAIKEKRGEVSSELSKYLVAKRTVWLYENKKNYIDLGIDKQSAQSFVEFVETGAHQHSKIIKESAGKIWEYGQKLLQVKKDHGIVDDALLSNLQEPYYVPFYRNIQDEKIAKNVPRGERFTTISKGIKRIKGSLSGKQIIDPVQNLMEHTYETMVNAHRADVANLLITMAEESEAVGEMFHKVDPKWVRVGTIEHRGEIDLILRPQIEELAKELGVTTEYKTKLATRIGGRLKKVLGQYREGGAIDLLVGATEGTYAHELGHAIHDRNEWYDNLVEKYDKELNAVADSRHEGTEAPQSYVSYCRSKPEKAAEFISMYITDRKALKKHVPEMLVEFEKKIAKDSILKKMVGMKPSNIKGINSVEENNFVQDWHIPQDADVISVLRDGKIVSYRVPIEVADAVTNLHPVMFPMWFKVLMTPNRILRKAAVTWNIDFMFPNSFRDQQESAINARSIPVYDWFVGLKEYAFNGDWFKRYHRAGGSMESTEAGVRGFSKSAETLKYGSAYGKYLDQYYWQETGLLRGSAAIAWEVMKFPFKTIEVMGEASEMASRVGTFRRVQVGAPKWLEWYAGKKKTEEQAMHIARQATLDFQRFGSYGRSLNEIVPFINAAIQGTDKMVRTFKDDPKRAILTAIIYGFAPMIGLWLWNKDDEAYAGIPLQEKLNNFIISLPGGRFVKIPKGHITKFVVNPFQVALEKINKKVTKSEGQAALQMMDDISPVDVSSMPIALRLIIEPMANYDLYWKREIEKYWMKAKDPGDRVNTRTSYLIKKIGKALNISPIMMQHEIEVLGAGTAKNALWAADNILVMAGIAQGDIDPKRFMVEKTPVTRRFYGKITEYGDDIDQSISDIDKQLSKENDKNDSQINQKRIKLLYEKRDELVKAKSAIREILDAEE